MKKLGSTKGTLQLSKETMRVLTTQDLENVAGGAQSSPTTEKNPPTSTNPVSCYYICQLK